MSEEIKELESINEDNETLSVIASRRSCRSFKDTPVEDDKILQIVAAGLEAPSGKNSQSSIVIAILNKELRDQFEKLNCEIGGWKEGFDPFYGAPVILAVLAKKDVKTHVYDGTCTMENMLIATESLGLGGIWINRCKEEFETEFGKNLLKDLGIEEEYEGIGHVALGYADGEPKEIEIKDDRAFIIR